MALLSEVRLRTKTLTDWRAICIFKKCERFFTLPRRERMGSPRGRHMLRPGLSGVHGRLLPLRVFSCPCHPECGVMPRLRGKAAQLLFSPALPASEEPSAGRGGAARAVPGQSERKDFSGRTASEERLPRMQKNLRPGKRRRFFVFFQKRAPTALYLWESRCRWGRTGPRSSGRPCQEPWPGP